MELNDLYRDVMDRIRAKNPKLVINLTTGPGGRFVPSEEDPKIAGPGTTLMAPEKRVEHVEILKPEICTLDLNTMNSGGQGVINTPPNVRKMAARMRAAGVLPELELFDSGDIHLARDLIADGTLQGPPLCTLVLGVKYGFDPSPETMLYARNLLARPFLAPPGTPGDRAQALRAAFAASLRDPQLLSDAAAANTDIDLVTGEEVERIIMQSFATPPALIKRIRAALER